MQPLGWFFLALVGALDVFNVYLQVMRAKRGSGMSPFRVYGTLLLVMGTYGLAFGSPEFFGLNLQPHAYYKEVQMKGYINFVKYTVLALIAHNAFQFVAVRGVLAWMKIGRERWI